MREDTVEETKEFQRAQTEHRLYSVIREARTESGLSLERTAETLVRALGIDAEYLAKDIKKITQKKYGNCNPKID